MRPAQSGLLSIGCSHKISRLVLFLINHLVRSANSRSEIPFDFKFWNLDFALQNQRITLSALASTFGGIVSPSCFAVFRLTTSSNLLACSTGKSAGLAPFRILST